MNHYEAFPDGKGGFFFTSPIGRHQSQWNERECVGIIAKVRAAHVERAKGDGHEATILAAYFEGNEAPAAKEPLRAMEAVPCKGARRLHAWIYNEATGFWHCSECRADKRDFDRAYRAREAFMAKKNHAEAR